MTKQVSWNVEATIKPGQLEAFHTLKDEMIASTRDGEPDTLRYQWFIAGDSVHILETYGTSEAGMAHLATLGQRFAERLMAACEIQRLFVYGEPSDELRAALGMLGAQYMTPVGGFSR